MSTYTITCRYCGEPTGGTTTSETAAKTKYRCPGCRRTRTPEERIAEAWRLADAHALTIADHNERERFLGYMIDAKSSDTRKKRMLEIQDALDSVWAEYARVKGVILAGGDATFDPANCLPRPWTIWDIAVS